jgi:hypothetical protein
MPKLSRPRATVKAELPSSKRAGLGTHTDRAARHSPAARFEPAGIARDVVAAFALDTGKDVRAALDALDAPESSVCAYCDRRPSWHVRGEPRCSWHLHGGAPAALTREARERARRLPRALDIASESPQRGPVELLGSPGPLGALRAPRKAPEGAGPRHRARMRGGR